MFISRNPQKSTYILKVATTNGSGRPAMPIYSLINQATQQADEFDSAEDLVSAVAPSTPVDQTAQLSALRGLVQASSNRLNQLRSMMSDRLSSAADNLRMISRPQGRIEAAEAVKTLLPAESENISESLEDMAKMALILNEWSKLCEEVETDRSQIIEIADNN